MSDNIGLISIIMAAYNAENTIEQAISSVLAQTYRNFELIVVNDCSSDNTADIVNHLLQLDGRIRLINNMQNSGVSFTRKHGLEVAKGDWIAIIDSDDAWRKDKLEKQAALQKEKNASLVFSGSGFMDAEGKPIEWYQHAPPEIGYRQLLKQNLISNSSVLVRKELYTKYYVIGDNMHEDFALWLEMLKCGNHAYGVDEPLIVYRISRLSKSGNKLNAAIMNWNTYRYVGLGVISAAYYECFYMVKGILKYRNLK